LWAHLALCRIGRPPTGYFTKRLAEEWLRQVLSPLGLALIGSVAEAVGVSTALYLCGAAQATLLLLLLTVREVRTAMPRPASSVDETAYAAAATEPTAQRSAHVASSPGPG
jgi:hypothetical protein